MQTSWAGPQLLSPHRAALPGPRGLGLHSLFVTGPTGVTGVRAWDKKAGNLPLPCVALLCTPVRGRDTLTQWSGRHAARLPPPHEAPRTAAERDVTVLAVRSLRF